MVPVSWHLPMTASETEKPEKLEQREKNHPVALEKQGRAKK
jgi:hypothetical protein